MTTHRAVGPLRVLLVLLFAALLVGQAIAVPWTLRYLAEEEPTFATLQWPLLVAAVLGLACAQVVIVCTWKLLTLVKDGRIFSDASLVWVDVIMWAIAGAWMLLLGALVYLAVNVTFEPGLPALLVLMLVAGAVLGLLVVVLRALLRQATTLQTDMEAVI